MNKYQKAKEKIRELAIEWQNDFCNHNYSWGELAFYSGFFEEQGRRYGLLKEFRENGVI